MQIDHKPAQDMNNEEFCNHIMGLEVQVLHDFNPAHLCDLSMLSGIKGLPHRRAREVSEARNAANSLYSSQASRRYALDADHEVSF